MSGIIQYWRRWRWRLAHVSWLAIVGAIASSRDCAVAQITPDGTLGAESSVVTPLDPDFPVDQIDGGAIRGANLFHSFREFNIDEGRGAYFTNPAGIENILSRVTGGNPSNILGRLGVLGNANLFLINPNGIIFGPNARLDVGGSFVGTTANAIRLASGDIFSGNPGEPLPNQLLNVSPNAFLFNQIAAQPIINRSIIANSSELEVPEGRSLLLMGRDVRLEAGQLLAPGGRVELGGLASTGTIGLSVNGSYLGLSFPDGVARADVSLTNRAIVDVTAGGGSIAINARNLNILGESRLLAGIETGLELVGSQPGDIEINAIGTINLNNSFITNAVLPKAVGNSGNIDITTGSLFVTNGALLATGTSGQGNAGRVNINARDTVSFDGVDSNGYNSVAFSIVELGAEGNGGDINITAESLSLTNGAQVSANTYGQGNAGSVNINARDTVSFDGVSSNGFDSAALSQVGLGAMGNSGGINITTGSLSVLNGAALRANTEGQGNAGSVNINARDTVSFDGVDSNGFYSVANSQVAPTAEGKGGDLNITAGSLYVRNGARLSASTFGPRDAGSVNINARDTVSFDGVGRNGLSTAAFSTVESGAVGKGGDLNITTRSLSVLNGAALSVITYGQGNAGNVNINARDTVSFDGVGSNGFYSGIGSGVAGEAEGNGGGISITTGSLALTNGARLSASTLGEGDAGNVNINARDTVSFDGVGRNGLSTAAFSTVESGAVGKGGGIIITTGSLALTNGAKVNARTRGQGDAGNITLNANTLEAVNGGQVFTTSFSSGKAGNIIVNIADSVTLAGSDRTYSERLAQFSEEVFAGAGPASGLFANTVENSTGQGGDLTITSGQLVVRDDAQVNVSSEGTGNAGNLEVTSRDLRLDNRAVLSSSTSSGEGGNIKLRDQDLILMRRNSEISTSAGGTGNGGNIDIIDADLLVAVPGENSDIVADAFKGNGGNINIRTSGIFGIEFRERRTSQSDITASSDFGLDGTVNINTPDVDPSRGLINLPAVPVDTEVTQGCTAGGSQAKSEFIVTGRGGLPPNPGDSLSTDAVQVDLITLKQEVARPSTTAVSTSPTSSKPARIVEAQGWVIGANGEVILTANAATLTPHSSWHTPANCHMPKTSS